MDLDKENFYYYLPTLLDQVEKSLFVAIDLEMSGIDLDNSRADSKLPPEEAYLKAKEVAETFAVVEVGLTCIQFDDSAKAYVTYTWNCPVSYLFPEGGQSALATEALARTFSLSAKTHQFLQENGFDANHIWNSGVPYLSRDDIEKVKRRYKDKRTIKIRDLDADTRQYLTQVRARIDHFMRVEREKGTIQVLIYGLGKRNLTRYQINLVFQLLRDEFPECVGKLCRAGSQSYAIAVTLRQPGIIGESDGTKLRDLQDIDKLSGLRLVFEALSGGSFASEIHREWVCLENPPEGSQHRNVFNRGFDFQKCEASLKQRRPILVGHNLFYDLVFLHKTFIGQLPPTLDTFLHMIHTQYPRIVDTKYMHSRSNSPYYPLDLLYQRYSKRPRPAISSAPGFNYQIKQTHRAGYDSFMTAVLFVKQTYALYRKGGQKELVGEHVYASGNPGPASTGAGKLSILDEDDDVQTSLNLLPPMVATSRKGGNESGRTHIIDTKALLPIPLWNDAFWEAYGNKTKLAHGGLVSFA
ncbi:ribonuclease H-like domain-containing protein [Xylariomycetidae sp. FL2044]|nr:ribonuclease H-like domain-containing protein [Xylariomycetidae sp. FL2044]